MHHVTQAARCVVEERPQAIILAREDLFDPIGQNTIRQTFHALGQTFDNHSLFISIPQTNFFGITHFADRVGEVDAELFVFRREGLRQRGCEITLGETIKAMGQAIDNGLLLLIPANTPLFTGLTGKLLLSDVRRGFHDFECVAMGVDDRCVDSLQPNFFAGLVEAFELSTLRLAMGKELPELSVLITVRKLWLAEHLVMLTDHLVFAVPNSLQEDLIDLLDVALGIKLDERLIAIEGFDHACISPLFGHILPLKNSTDVFALKVHDSTDIEVDLQITD